LLGPKLFIFLRHHDRHLQANTLCGEYVTPIPDKFFICLAYGTYLSVEIVEADLVDFALFLAKSYSPVDLVCQRIPRKTNHRHAIITHAQHICPFLPKPSDRLVPFGTLPQVCLGVHRWYPIAV